MAKIAIKVGTYWIARLDGTRLCSVTREKEIDEWMHNNMIDEGILMVVEDVQTFGPKWLGFFFLSREASDNTN